MNLLEHFQTMHARRGALGAALRDMSAVLSCTYDVNRFGQWRRGEVPVPPAVQAYMREHVYLDVHRQNHGRRFTRDIVETLIEVSNPPSPKPEKRYGRGLHEHPEN